jgi:predicted DCC family thiol-disulfide oxidoreductase YuxK
MKEMLQLKAADKAERIIFADLHAEGFAQRYPHIDPQQAYNQLHVETDNGEMLYGLDANCAIWQAVGKNHWLKILRWPIIRWFADIAYGFFARNREMISRLLTGKPRCDVCSVNVERELNSRNQQNTI